MFATTDAAETWFGENDPEGVAFEYGAIEKKEAATEVASLVNFAELLFQFGDLFFRSSLERFIDNEHKKLPILHDLHFKLYTLVFVTHGSIPCPFRDGGTAFSFSGILILVLAALET